MASEENIYEKLQELFGYLDGNLKILEEQIDIDVQSEYYQYSKNFDQEFDPEDVIKNKENIFKQHTPEENKKCMLVQLASINSIEAFRTIERFANDPGQDLQDWAKLALQESKLLLESKILDENQVLISTGLGGKGLKLRYFVVFIARGTRKLTNLQKSIVKKESEFAIRRSSGEIEEIGMKKNFITILALLPLSVPVQSLFNKIIDECNQLGNFLYQTYLITNLKQLSDDEIEEFMTIHYNQLK
ncbi:MAG: hypothetical protein JXB00_13910 [Bacteroidales bacterium]|nr:hypothetical protein [Bacteroidales bacterium]